MQVHFKGELLALALGGVGEDSLCVLGAQAQAVDVVDEGAARLANVVAAALAVVVGDAILDDLLNKLLLCLLRGEDRHGASRCEGGLRDALVKRRHETILGGAGEPAANLADDPGEASLIGCGLFLVDARVADGHTHAGRRGAVDLLDSLLETGVLAVREENQTAAVPRVALEDLVETEPDAAVDLGHAHAVDGAQLGARHVVRVALRVLELGRLVKGHDGHGVRLVLFGRLGGRGQVVKQLETALDAEPVRVCVLSGRGRVEDEAHDATGVVAHLAGGAAGLQGRGEGGSDEDRDAEELHCQGSVVKGVSVVPSKEPRCCCFLYCMLALSPRLPLEVVFRRTTGVSSIEVSGKAL